MRIRTESSLISLPDPTSVHFFNQGLASAVNGYRHRLVNARKRR